MTTIDARGLSCPEPVLRTKQALASGDNEYEILVDNSTAMQNVTRFSQRQGYTVSTTAQDGHYALRLCR